MSKTAIAGLFALSVVLAACGGKEKANQETATQEQTTQTQEPAPTEQTSEPSVIAVQHILIGFQGSLPGKPVSRTKEEAKALADQILARAEAGEDFDALVKQYTDDSHPGIYRMSNRGVAGDPAQGIYPRERMVPAFGNVGFPLAVGGIGMAEYDANTSPYGWHIIKRLE